MGFARRGPRPMMASTGHQGFVIPKGAEPCDVKNILSLIRFSLNNHGDNIIFDIYNFIVLQISPNLPRF
jgi:hypothetical protein